MTDKVNWRPAEVLNQSDKISGIILNITGLVVFSVLVRFREPPTVSDHIVHARKWSHLFVPGPIVGWDAVDKDDGLTLSGSEICQPCLANSDRL